MKDAPEINYSLHDELIKIQAQKMHNSEIVMLKDILKAIIKREPTIEDFKKLERVYLKEPDWYRLFYNGKSIGKMEFVIQPLKFDESTRSVSRYWNLKFTPEVSLSN
ncbi:MAG: hypothetical protein ACOCVA_00835 [Prolixibacteraceae bacterium]